MSIGILERIEGKETLRRDAMLIPQGDATFFTSGSVLRAPDANELVKFERDSKGAVTGLNWPQKSRDKVSARKIEAIVSRHASHRQMGTDFQARGQV